MVRRRRLRVVLSVALLGVVASCAPETKPDVEKGPIGAPRAQLAVRYQLGGPLRGARAPGLPLGPDSANPARALSLEASVVALAALPAASIMLVSSETRIVIAEGQAGGALRASPRTLSEARASVVDGPAARVVEAAVVDSGARGHRLGTVKACLLPGTTTVFEVGRDEPPGLTGEVKHLRASVLLGRSVDGASVEAAVEISGAEGTPEIVLLSTLLVGGSAPHASGAQPVTWVAQLPSPFGAEDEARWIAFVVDVAPPLLDPAPGAAAHGEIVAGAARELAAQAEMARLAVAPLPPPTELPDLVATRRALADRTTARRGLYALGHSTGARTAETIAVATDEQTVAQIGSAVAGTLASQTAKGTAADMGIVVELATLSACRQALLADPPPDDLPDALEWRGGAALRLLPTLGVELERAKSLDDLEARIVAINVRLLLDASPMIRARAAHWLGGRVSLEGYSPLAPSAERRAAVDRIKKRQAEAARGQR